ncbi:MAG: 4-vinyl reductase [Clostridiales bacterium]|nr:4-vinyl reductase [Clostridiales bacterium]
MRKYEFSWDLLGNIEDGRANMGNFVDVGTYRLMQFTLRDVMEEEFGSEIVDKIFYSAGYKAGTEFYRHNIHPVSSDHEFLQKMQEVFKDKKIGILRVEEALLDDGRVVVAIDEDLDCSGLPELDYETCIYDEGFMSAMVGCYTQQEWVAKEIDCWCTGARTCRFMITKKP